MPRQRIYRFESGRAEGRAEWKALLGGKGANLAEMAAMGIPVPPGFTITTETCVEFMQRGDVPEHLWDEVGDALQWLEQTTGKRFGDPENPLLVSVRSGARSSMPGMMDTILDLGLSDATVGGLARKSQSERFAYDAYRRFLAMFGNVVLGLDHTSFEHALFDARVAQARRRSVGLDKLEDPEALSRILPDSVLEADILKGVVEAYKRIVASAHGPQVVDEPRAQLQAAILAVFKSWNNPRARLYRRMHEIPDDWGTAVNVQAMVFGNLGDSSATGVAFTRDPSTGERRFFGEWLPNAQGEDVVAGIRTPLPLERLEERMPESYRQLFAIQEKLERRFRDMQDLEFTIEAGTLYLLQTRNGKRSARAAVRIAVEMVHEGLLHPDEALLRVDPERLQDLLFPSIDPHAHVSPVAEGLPASPGAVSGQIVFRADDAQAKAEQGASVILVRVETSPEDLHGMKAAKGILTARGGATSHAAVVARGMGRPCVAGCAALAVHEATGTLDIYAADGSIAASLGEGDILTLDGTTGRVYVGPVPTIETGLSPEMAQLLAWTEGVRRMHVRANADTPAQARKALEFGAEGIGLCRTEHMFFEDERIEAVREMIVAQNVEAREAALAKLLPFQRDDFTALFTVMQGFPVTIRLLDPPLHEFLPQEDAAIEQIALRTGVTPQDVRRRINELHEFNPMLGHRGVRLAVSYPEIAKMQLRAIFEAACQVQRQGTPVLPEIMIPLAFSSAELRMARGWTEEIAACVFAETGIRVEYRFGSMIELPRAALLADQLAHESEFFSFGTNDLTQTCLGLSRDDAGSFLPRYVEHRILPHDPFVSLDIEGVGELMRIASQKAREVRPEMHMGVCGEHGGDPRSIAFCEAIGLTYVSCSPFRVPIARVAAAQASLRRSGRYPV